MHRPTGTAVLRESGSFSPVLAPLGSVYVCGKVSTKLVQGLRMPGSPRCVVVFARFVDFVHFPPFTGTGLAFTRSAR